MPASQSVEGRATLRFRATHARAELSPLAGQVARLRHRTTRERLGNPEFEIWSFAHITDLRTQAERYDGMR